MRAFVDAHRDIHGVEPICKVLQIFPSGYRHHAARQRNPALNCARVKRDALRAPHIERVCIVNLQIYGADKVWRQLDREGIGIEAAHCTVERLRRRQGLRGVMRGKVVRTTISDPEEACPLDGFNRQFTAQQSNQLWVSDFTYVSTWQGWFYVAFGLDVFGRRIVGWRVSNSMHTDFVLDALEHALRATQHKGEDALIHHSAGGSQYVSIRHSERLAEAGIEPLLNSYDNVLAETINGLHRAELIHRCPPRETEESPELATLAWESCVNHRRLPATIRYVPPAVAGTAYYEVLAARTVLVSLRPAGLL